MDTIRLFRTKEGKLSLPTVASIPDAIVATVGTFDGVHRGHQFLFDDLLSKARETNLPSAVITFDRPPVATVCPSRPYYQINDAEERAYYLSLLAIDYLFILPFDRLLADLSTEEFLSHLLFDLLHVHYLVSGYDNRFGKKKEGETECNVETLCNQLGMLYHRSSPAYDEKGREYSSSLVRQLLIEGKVKEGAALLGYPYTLIGKVVGGSKLGRKFGFPTANIEPSEDHKLIPLKGVYAAWAAWLDEKGELHSHQGMLYIGNRPSISSKLEPRIEINLFDFSGDLYGKRLCIALLDYVRGDVRFENTDHLVEQLKRDETTIRELLLQASDPFLQSAGGLLTTRVKV